jgi:hypothetical protein
MSQRNGDRTIRSDRDTQVGVAMVDVSHELRELIRDAHGAVRDLRTVMKEYRELRASIPKLVSDEYNRIAVAQVEEGLEEWKQALERSLQFTADAVDARFQGIVDLLVGEDKKTKAAGLPSIAELVRVNAAAEKIQADGF